MSNEGKRANLKEDVRRKDGDRRLLRSEGVNAVSLSFDRIVNEDVRILLKKDDGIALSLSFELM